ncbi:MAG: hypothetical protein JKY51_05810, partial [Opitutaceae bacterium]|nr:hypothetical protein [Opitutaceae bacterium]
MSVVEFQMPEELDVLLSASNSSGAQKLYLILDDDSNYFFTLVGRYDNKDIQIDFDTMSKAELTEARDMIDIML